MIEEIKALRVQCDGCRDVLHTDDLRALFQDEQDVDEILADQGWTSDKGTHLCPTCVCDRETGHALAFIVNAGTGRSCRCGERYEGHVLVKVAGGVL